MGTKNADQHHIGGGGGGGGVLSAGHQKRCKIVLKRPLLREPKMTINTNSAGSTMCLRPVFLWGPEIGIRNGGFLVSDPPNRVGPAQSERCPLSPPTSAAQPFTFDLDDFDNTSLPGHNLHSINIVVVIAYRWRQFRLSRYSISINTL